MRVGLLFVVDTAHQRPVGFREGLDGGEHVAVCCFGCACAKFGERKGESGHKLLVHVDDVGGQSDIE